MSNINISAFEIFNKIMSIFLVHIFISHSELFCSDGLKMLKLKIHLYGWFDLLKI